MPSFIVEFNITDPAVEVVIPDGMVTPDNIILDDNNEPILDDNGEFVVNP